MNTEQNILQALELHPLSTSELVHRFGAEVSVQEINNALYQLQEQKMWIQKHPVISGGCKSCACGVVYYWRLTFSGRSELAKQKGT